MQQDRISDERQPLCQPRPHPDRQGSSSRGGGGRPVLVGCILGVLAGVLGAIGIETGSLLALFVAALIVVLALLAIAQ